jgi:threonine/homoserine/homoserine lactone efflux protein
MSGSLFAGFLTITLVLILTPGPIVTRVVSTAATRGVRAGLITVAGMGRGWFMKPARAKLLGRVSGVTPMGGGIWLSLARRPTQT